MKLLRFATVALLAGGILVACDDDEPVVTPPAPVTPVAPPAPEPIVGSVSGTVSVEGSGLSGVNVGLVGAASQTATTGDNGGYSFSNVPGGTHGVQISGFPAEVAFVSTASVVTIATSGQNATADFSGNYIRTSTITGTITAGTEGVVATVTATGAGMLMSEEPVAGSSNPDGDFELTGLRAGTYHVTISDFPEGIEFPVTTRDVTVGVGLSANVSFSAPGEDTGDDTGAFVFISGVTSEATTDADPDPDAHRGRVTVTASVERGTARFEKLTLYVDGVEVDSQDFGVPASEPADEPETGGESDPEMAAAQQVFEFKLGFDSDDYDEAGTPDYMNGEHTLSVGLRITGGATLPSNEVTVEFDNPDGFVVSANLGQASVVADDGSRWYGGPANGPIVISALPVIYSGEETGAVTIGLGDECEAEEGDNPLSVEFDCEGEVADRPITVSAGGNEANILNANDLPDANIDMEGPAVAPNFHPNPNNRENGWVNLAVLLATQAGEHNPTNNEDGWLTYNDDGADDTGAGGYQPVIRYAEADNGSVEDAIGAAPLSAMNLPGESAMDHYCVVVSAVDALGNESALPDEDDGMCLMAGVAATYNDDGTVNVAATANSYELLLQGLRLANALPDDAAGVTTKADAIAAAQEALADAGILAGVDLTPPGIEIDEDERINVATDLSFDFDAFDDENDVANSGLHSTAPLLVRIQRRTTDDTECLDIGDGQDGTTAGEVENGDDESCTADPTALANNTAITFGATPATSHAYYTLTGSAVDQAGNSATPVSHTFVFDADPAEATTPAAPGSIDSGEVFQIASFLNDDLSIRDYYVTANFAGDIDLGIVTPTVVDAFDAATLTHRNHTVTVDVDTYAGMTTDPATASEASTGVTIAVRDQAQSGTPQHTEVTAALTVDDPGTSDNFTDNFSAALSAIDAVCVAEDEDDCAEANRESETELEVVATADAVGAFSDPFERVDFWMQDVNGASWLIGSDTSGESGRVSATNRARTWTYSLEVSADVLYMLTREAAFPPGSDSDSHTVRAFGVNDDGVAYALSGAVTIDDGETDQ